MRFLKKSPFLLLVLLISSVLLIQGCDDDNNRPTGPDYSFVPDAYNLSDATSSFTKDGGVEIHIIEEGICPGGTDCVVEPVDQIRVKYTGRIYNGGDGEGEIFESTFVDSIDTPAIISNLTPNSTDQQPAQIEGFRRGLLGMQEKEKRVIIVPPELGYDDSRPGVSGIDLRGDSLRYDVELTNLGQ
jgi:FKBP-type peptidyl-prolyl cis-trans isomerase